MDRIREQVSRPVVAAGAAFVVGLIIGWMILGWALFPVEWTDASAQHLRPDLKLQWLQMTIESYGRTGDAQTALQRWQELGDEGQQLLPQVIADTNVDPQAAAQFANLIQSQTGVVAVEPGAQQPTLAETRPTDTGVQVPGAVQADDEAFNPTFLLGGLCLIVLVVGGAMVYFFAIRNRPGAKLIFNRGQGTRESYPSRRREPARYSQEPDAGAYDEGPQPAAYGYQPEEDADAPVARFMSTYHYGEDDFNELYTIDSPTGESMGECGVNISHTVGVGEPKKVTAFEVWLFDVNDIQTVTKVLMTDYAYNDPQIRERLINKGEPVVVEPGNDVYLETQTLLLEARVVDQSYGQGGMPDSFFDRLTLELTVWRRQ
jgi:hypothetical protein